VLLTIEEEGKDERISSRQCGSLEMERMKGDFRV